MSCSFFNLSVTSPASQLIIEHVALATSQLILQPFRCCTYITAHSPTLLSLLLPFRHFTCVTAHSPTLPSVYLRHSSFSKPSIASPTSQHIFQPFFRFSYVTGSSLTSPRDRPCDKYKIETILLSCIEHYIMVV